MLVSLTENLETSERIMIAPPVEADNIPTVRILKDRTGPIKGFFPDRREPKETRGAGTVFNFGDDFLRRS
jgi:hypothetical protein